MKTISPILCGRESQIDYQDLVDNLNSGKLSIQQAANKLGISEPRMIRKLRNVGYHKRGKFLVYNPNCV